MKPTFFPSISILLFAIFISSGCRKTVVATTESSAREQSRESTSRKTDVDWEIAFIDHTAQSGIDFTYRNDQEANHYAILEELGGGIAFFDFDGDSRLDVFMTGGGQYKDDLDTVSLPNGLFRGLGEWRWTNVAGLANIRNANHYSHGIGVGDYNEDGFADVLVTGYGGLDLFLNEGDGTFREVHAEAGLTDASWSSSAAWGDLNGDGLLDLYVAHYTNWSFDNHPFCRGPTPEQREVCSPKEYLGLNDILYLNNGDGTFTDATQPCGLVNGGKGLGVLLADFDNDSTLDIYVSNDTVENFLYLNQGSGRLRETAVLAGVAVDDSGVPNGSMGLAIFDPNGDGYQDIWVTNYEREPFALYRNEGNDIFTHISRSSGITALGGLYVGFGTGIADFNADGRDDIVVTDGHVIRLPSISPRWQLPLLLLGGETRFRQVRFPANSYFGQPHLGRGLALGDLDHDGDQDIGITHLNEPAVILENKTVQANNWLAVRLIGVRSPRDAIGARLELTTSRGTSYRQVFGGGSYLSHHDRTVLWTLPEDTVVEELRVNWPAGTSQVVASPPRNQTLTIIESTR